MRLLNRLCEHARQRPEAEALRAVSLDDAPESWSYRRLYHAAMGLAHHLRSRLTPGATVLLCSRNRPEYHVGFFAALAGGFTVFPLSPESAPAELHSAADRAGAEAILGCASTLAAMGKHPIVPIDLQGAVFDADSSPAGDAVPAMLLQSSGTTALPKIVRRSADSLDAACEAMAEGIGFGPEDRVLAVVPLCHSYGVEHGLLAPMWAGSAVHVACGFDLMLLKRELSQSGITILPGVPSMFEILAGLWDPSEATMRLRRAYSAGGPLPIGVYKAFLTRHATRIGGVYGATEIGSVTFNDPLSPRFDPDGVGMPLCGVSIRILDPDSGAERSVGTEGHVAVRSASMLCGYVGDSAPPPLADGHFLTGDLGRLDAHGGLTLTGRLKLLIEVGGLKVNPLEVEAVLMTHPGVAAAVVLPLQLSQTIHRLRAVIELRAGVVAPSAQELRRFARSRLAGHKVPRVIEFRDALPRGSTGKISRHRLASEGDA